MGIINKLIQRATRKTLEEMADNETYRFVFTNDLFKDLSNEAYLFIMKRIVERRYQQGELVFKQDNPGVCLFIVKRGAVEIYFRRPEDEQKKIVYGVVEHGFLFGEISVVSNSYRTASAKAAENDTVLLTLSSFDLKELQRLYPADGYKVLKGITDTVIRHLENTTKKLQETTLQLEELERKLANETSR